MYNYVASVQCAAFNEVFPCWYQVMRYEHTHAFSSGRVCAVSGPSVGL